MVRKFILLVLFLVLIFIAAFYISVLQGILVYVFWNFLIAPICGLDPVSFLVGVGILTIPNVFLMGHKFFRLYRKC
jgi:hypothetical protein